MSVQILGTEHAVQSMLNLMASKFNAKLAARYPALPAIPATPETDFNKGRFYFGDRDHIQQFPSMTFSAVNMLNMGGKSPRSGGGSFYGTIQGHSHFVAVQPYVKSNKADEGDSEQLVERYTRCVLEVVFENLDLLDTQNVIQDALFVGVNYIPRATTEKNETERLGKYFGFAIILYEVRMNEG